MNLNDLKNIDLQKLKDINVKDLQNIDIEQIKSFLTRYLDFTVNIAASIITVIVCVQVFTNHSKSMKSVSGEINTQQALLTVVEQNKSHLKKYSELKQEFKKYLPGDEIITELSNIAVNTNVQIEKLTPRKEKKIDLLQVSYLDIELSSTDYENIIAFTKSVELLENSIRIENWAATSSTIQQTTGRNKRGTQQEIETIDKILLKLTLSSVNILQ